MVGNLGLEEMGIVVSEAIKERSGFSCWVKTVDSPRTVTVFVSENRLPIFPTSKGAFVVCDHYSASIAPNISPLILSTCH